MEELDIRNRNFIIDGQFNTANSFLTKFETDENGTGDYQTTNPQPSLSETHPESEDGDDEDEIEVEDDDDGDGPNCSPTKAFYLIDEAERFFKFRRNLSVDIDLNSYSQHMVHIDQSLDSSRRIQIPFASISFADLCSEVYGKEYIRLPFTPFNKKRFVETDVRYDIQQKYEAERDPQYEKQHEGANTDPIKTGIATSFLHSSENDSKKRRMVDTLVGSPGVGGKRRCLSEHHDKPEINSELTTLPSLLNDRLDPLRCVIRDLELRLSQQGGIAHPLSYLGKGDDRYDVDDPMFDDKEMWDHFGLSNDAVTRIQGCWETLSNTDFDVQRFATNKYDDSSNFSFDCNEYKDHENLPSLGDNEDGTRESLLSSEMPSGSSSDSEEDSSESLSFSEDESVSSDYNDERDPRAPVELDTEYGNGSYSISEANVDVEEIETKVEIDLLWAKVNKILDNASGRIREWIVDWREENDEFLLYEFKPSLPTLISDVGRSWNQRYITRKLWLAKMTLRLFRRADNLNAEIDVNVNTFVLEFAKKQIGFLFRSLHHFAQPVMVWFSHETVAEISQTLKIFKSVVINEDDVKGFYKREDAIVRRIKLSSFFSDTGVKSSVVKLQNEIEKFERIQKKLDSSRLGTIIQNADASNNNSPCNRISNKSLDVTTTTAESSLVRKEDEKLPCSMSLCATTSVQKNFNHHFQTKSDQSEVSMTESRRMISSSILNVMGSDLLEYAQLCNLRKYSMRCAISLRIDKDLQFDEVTLNELSSVHWTHYVQDILQQFLLHRYGKAVNVPRKYLDFIVRLARRRAKDAPIFDRRPLPTLETSPSQAESPRARFKFVASSPLVGESLHAKMKDHLLQQKGKTRRTSKSGRPVIAKDESSMGINVLLESPKPLELPLPIIYEYKLTGKKVGELELNETLQIVSWRMPNKDELHKTTSLAAARVLIRKLLGNRVKELMCIDTKASEHTKAWQAFSVRSRNNKSLYDILVSTCILLAGQTVLQPMSQQINQLSVTKQETVTLTLTSIGVFYHAANGIKDSSDSQQRKISFKFPLSVAQFKKFYTNFPFPPRVDSVSLGVTSTSVNTHSPMKDVSTEGFSSDVINQASPDPRFQLPADSLFADIGSSNPFAQCKERLNFNDPIVIGQLNPMLKPCLDDVESNSASISCEPLEQLAIYREPKDYLDTDQPLFGSFIQSDRKESTVKAITPILYHVANNIPQTLTSSRSEFPSVIKEMNEATELRFSPNTKTVEVSQKLTNNLASNSQIPDRPLVSTTHGKLSEQDSNALLKVPSHRNCNDPQNQQICCATLTTSRSDISLKSHVQAVHESSSEVKKQLNINSMSSVYQCEVNTSLIAKKELREENKQLKQNLRIASSCSSVKETANELSKIAIRKSVKRIEQVEERTTKNFKPSSEIKRWGFGTFSLTPLSDYSTKFRKGYVYKSRQKLTSQENSQPLSKYRSKIQNLTDCSAFVSDEINEGHPRLKSTGISSHKKPLQKVIHDPSLASDESSNFRESSPMKTVGPRNFPIKMCVHGKRTIQPHDKTIERDLNNTSIMNLWSKNSIMSTGDISGKEHLDSSVQCENATVISNEKQDIQSNMSIDHNNCLVQAIIDPVSNHCKHLNASEMMITREKQFNNHQPLKNLCYHSSLPIVHELDSKNDIERDCSDELKTMNSSFENVPFLFNKSNLPVWGKQFMPSK